MSVRGDTFGCMAQHTRLAVAALPIVPILSGCGNSQPEPGAESSTVAPVEASETGAEPSEATQVPVPMAPPSDAATITANGVTGVLGVNAVETPGSDEECWAVDDRFSEIDEGTQVVIMGDGGNVVALAELEPATWNEEQSSCAWYFSVRIPRGEDFYQAEIEGFGKSEVVAESELSDGSAAFFVIPND